MVPQAERVFLNEGNVLVTNTRVVISAQTFALANITSVKVSPDEDFSTRLGVPFFGAGLILGVITLFRLDSFPMCLAVVFLGVTAGLFVGQLLKRRMVVIVSSGSEMKALISRDEHFIRRTAQAISNAIIARG